MEKAKRIFEKNTEANELYATSDGQHFFNAEHAKSHADKLADKAVTTITREAAEAYNAEGKEATTGEVIKARIEKVVAEGKSKADSKKTKEAEKNAAETTDAAHKVADNLETNNGQLPLADGEVKK